MMMGLSELLPEAQHQPFRSTAVAWPARRRRPGLPSTRFLARQSREQRAESREQARAARCNHDGPSGDARAAAGCRR